MNKIIFNMLGWEWLCRSSYIPFFKEVNIHWLGKQGPNSNVEFTCIKKKRLLDVFLNYKRTCIQLKFLRWTFRLGVCWIGWVNLWLLLRALFYQWWFLHLFLLLLRTFINLLLFLYFLSLLWLLVFLRLLRLIAFLF